MKTNLFYLLTFSFCCYSLFSFGQTIVEKDSIQFSALSTPGSSDILNDGVSFIPPSPEAASLFKASSPSVNEATGSPQVGIGLGHIIIPGYGLDISLRYSSIGIKVDDYASMVGMGWDLSYGGVISRTVLDEPDENRTVGNNNLTVPEYTLRNASVMNFLENATDKQSDIFMVALPGFTAKFILDVNFNPVFLENNNYRITRIGTNFQDGFTVVSSEGVEFVFSEKEVSSSRSPTGSNCMKTFDGAPVVTSWYLKTIRSADTRSTLTFHYGNSLVTSEGTVTQTISSVRWSENYPDGGEPAFTVGDNLCSTCIPVQNVSAKYIESIVSHNGDQVLFQYDVTSRQDLDGGRRLSQVIVKDRHSVTLRRALLYSTYKISTGHTGTYYSRRLFLDSLTIDDGNTIGPKERYGFSYNQPQLLPPRLTYGQDHYGFANGKNSNPSLLPKLSSGDVNYTLYNNGTGSPLMAFGDRSIDTAYAKYGLLTRIVYPTRGYDSLIYRANRIKSGASEVLAGGSSVYELRSYTANNVLATTQRYVYRFQETGELSSVLLNNNLIYSYVSEMRKNGNHIHCQGPAGQFGVVTSSPVMPLTAFGTQHLYHRAVMVYAIDGAGSYNGLEERQYRIFLAGMMYGQILEGGLIPGAPNQVVPDVVIGKMRDRVFRKTSGADSLLHDTRTVLRIANLNTYPNYAVRRKYLYGCPHTFPLAVEFEAFDVTRIYVNSFTVLIDSIIDTSYDVPGIPQQSIQVFQYGSSFHTYPTQTRQIMSDGRERKVEMEYAAEKGVTFMLNKNLVSPVLEYKYYMGTQLLSRQINQYRDWFSDGKNIALEKSFELIGSDTVRVVQIHVRDVNNNILQVRTDRSVTSYLWGYGGQYPVATIENAGYAEVSAVLGTSAINALNSPLVSQSIINSTLAILRNHTNMRKARVTGHTYRPLVGMTSLTDPRGVTETYQYDGLQRLSEVLDFENYILRSYQYHYKP